LIRFKDHKAVEQFLEQIYAHPEFQEKYPVAAALPVVVRQRKGKVYAHFQSWDNTIALHNSSRKRDAWAMRSDTCTHELSHSVVHAQWGRGVEVADHGAEFRGVLCNLYSWFISPEAGELLRTSFREAKLEC
jgi:putative metallohydrolase (TIGR04338 family)